MTCNEDYLLAESKNGQTFQCPGCGYIHILYGNMHLSVLHHELDHWLDRSKYNLAQLEAYDDGLPSNIMMHSSCPRTKMVFSKDELSDFIDLISCSLLLLQARDLIQ